MMTDKEVLKLAYNVIRGDDNLFLTTVTIEEDKSLRISMHAKDKQRTICFSRGILDEMYAGLRPAILAEYVKDCKLQLQKDEPCVSIPKKMLADVVRRGTFKDNYPFEATRDIMAIIQYLRDKGEVPEQW